MKILSFSQCSIFDLIYSWQAFTFLPEESGLWKSNAWDEHKSSTAKIISTLFTTLKSYTSPNEPILT